ncbi:MAG: glycosyltransferase [Lentimonas sp.]
MSARVIAWVTLFIACCIAAFAYASVTPTFDAPSKWRVYLCVVLGVLGLFLTLLMPRFSGWRLPIFGIWMPAILLRFMLFPTAPSDDVNRYLWEGHLLANGISPYAQTADAESLMEYRDDFWQAMNHKDKPTAYPPLAELGFAVVVSMAYNPLTFKAFFVAADLLTLAAVLSLLRRRGLSQAYAGFYAFSPVVLIAFAGEAHFDAWMLAALVWAVWAAEVGRQKLAVVLISIASGVKWVTLPLLAFFVIRGFAGLKKMEGQPLACPQIGESSKDRSCEDLVPPTSSKYNICEAVTDISSYIFISLLILIIPGLCFWNSLPALFEGLFQFGGTRSFNGPIYDSLLSGCELPRDVCTAIVGGLFAGVLLWRWSVREAFTLDAHCRWVIGSLIVLSPTVHFWYLAWMLPFVCLRPSLPWLVLSVTSGTYFYVWINDAWGLSAAQRWMFWAPFFVALVYEVWSTRGRVIFPLRRDVAEPVSVSIVIPTLNAAYQLGGALASVARQSRAPLEVICVDAGSVDTTLEITNRSELPLRVLEAPQGRGQQIAAGIEAARGTWICVLHADAVLADSALENLVRSVKTDPAVMGGAFGQRFEENQAELLPIELLNDVRGLFSRTSFGDQVQFYHRESALRHELMPKQPLMEDVESSWRLREAGGFLFLNQPCEVCHRSWKASEWLTRFRLVMRLVSRYRFARLRSRERAKSLSESLYQEYYNKGK